ncbi:hypothetical protein [Streptomyces sp. NBC_00996]|uniref:hypothetical protein n=1 Tax=Streptomyces sp. NBC_00996 TaxID=2903710 RepID=UPI00386FBFC7|nr:hypothetical protein OG390_17675 [Streptomyces sp. NBC_00996]
MDEVADSRSAGSIWPAVGAALPLRLLAILVLVLGTASGLSHLLPARVGVTELSRDANPGGSLVVHVHQTDLLEVRATWSTGFLGDKEIVHHFDELPLAPGGVAAFEESVRHTLRADGKSVTFAGDDPLAGLGGLSMFVPVLYWRFIPEAWLRWSVVLCGLAVLGSIALRRKRRAGAGQWYAACLLAGSGFLAYLWCEPSPLWRPRPVGHPPMTGRRVATVTLAVFVGVVVSGVALAALRR